MAKKPVNPPAENVVVADAVAKAAKQKGYKAIDIAALVAAILSASPVILAIIKMIWHLDPPAPVPTPVPDPVPPAA